ncbi:hypothetical protein HK101_008800 [Irineochytrium annulatum]|nr:hypothetical protein HK101_008800 [Irineochytrium annulatum]
MTPNNLAIVWAPNLIRGASPVVDMTMCAVGGAGGGVGTMVKVMIEQWADVFRDEADDTEPLVGADGAREGGVRPARSPTTRHGSVVSAPARRGSVLLEDFGRESQVAEGLMKKRHAYAGLRKE